MSRYGWVIEQPERLHLLARGSCSALGVTFTTSQPFPAAGATPGQAALEHALHEAILSDPELMGYLHHRAEQAPPSPPAPPAPTRIPVPPLVPMHMASQARSSLPGQRIEGVPQPVANQLPPAIRSRLQTLLNRVAGQLAEQAAADFRAALAELVEVAAGPLDRLIESLAARQNLTNTGSLMPAACKLLESIAP